MSIPVLLPMCASKPVRVLAVALGMLSGLHAAEVGPVDLVDAERVVAGIPARVRLPDTVMAASDGTQPAHAIYRLHVHRTGRVGGLALFSPGLIAHARVSFNGHELVQPMKDVAAPLPRSIDRIRLIVVPDEFVKEGDNLIEIEATGSPLISVAPLSVGSPQALRSQFDARVLGAVVGPSIVAITVVSLAGCLLLLWARRRDSLYGYFGLGTMGWGLHSLWSASPTSPLNGIHHVVWWTSLYTFFVAMLVIFCVRFAGWRRVWLDRSLSALAACGPLLLYGAAAFGQLGRAAEIWLLSWVAVVGLGVVAVAHYAWGHRTVEGGLLAGTGAVSFAFAVRDWSVNHAGLDNNPIYLVPYAGLLFVVLVAWMLIDRFVGASRALAAMNQELEQRVSRKSGELLTALAQMRDAKEAAESANLAKSTFLAAASHDLRQPIHAMGLYMAALFDSKLEPGPRELVAKMNRSLQALQTMFSALLEVSRLEAGALTPQRRGFELDAILHRLADEIAPSASAKGLRLAVRIAPALHAVHAFSDPVLVERAVRNLLTNAVKYTQQGGVLLSCRQRGVGAGAVWRVEVWDTGPGIPPAFQERVFDEYFQIGNPARDRAGGLGLGLAIVRRVSALLGHPLTMSSVVGRGTRFSLDVPGTQRLPARAWAAAGWASLEGLVVAVVEDDPEVLDSMQTLLRRWGCEVMGGADAGSVLAAMAAASVFSVPHVIVADYRLGQDLTGLDAVQVLRQACGRALPALIVSGDSDPTHLARMQASGLDTLGKPVPADRLHGWLVNAKARIERADAMASGYPLLDAIGVTP